MSVDRCDRSINRLIDACEMVSSHRFICCWAFAWTSFVALSHLFYYADVDNAFIWVRFVFASTASHARLNLSYEHGGTWHANMTHVANIMPTNNTYDSSAPSYRCDLDRSVSSSLATVVPKFCVPQQLYTCVQYNLRLKAPTVACGFVRS